MKNILLGTHNTMTYLNPQNKFLCPFKWMSRCQSKTLVEQYEEYGARVFDIRLYYDNSNKVWVFKHGYMIYRDEYPGSVFNWLNRKGDTWCRIILETKKHDDLQEDKFIEFCKKLENMYPNIKFFGGERKYDWVKLYKFSNKDLSIDGRFSSIPENPKIYGIWPWLYSKINNKKFKSTPTNFECIFLDFINL